MFRHTSSCMIMSHRIALQNFNCLSLRVRIMKNEMTEVMHRTKKHETQKKLTLLMRGEVNRRRVNADSDLVSSCDADSIRWSWTQVLQLYGLTQVVVLSEKQCIVAGYFLVLVWFWLLLSSRKSIIKHLAVCFDVPNWKILPYLTTDIDAY